MDKFTKVMVAMVVSVMLAMLSALVGTGIYLAISEPYCPQEDSCSVDYRDGAWHIDERAPGSY